MNFWIFYFPTWHRHINVRRYEFLPCFFKKNSIDSNFAVVLLSFKLILPPRTPIAYLFLLSNMELLLFASLCLSESPQTLSIPLFTFHLRSSLPTSYSIASVLCYSFLPSSFRHPSMRFYSIPAIPLRPNPLKYFLQYSSNSYSTRLHRGKCDTKITCCTHFSTYKNKLQSLSVANLCKSRFVNGQPH